MSEQEIRVGQVWRHKKTGKLIRIARWSTSFVDDWFWEGHDYEGHGRSYGTYIRRNYELVTEGNTLMSDVTKPVPTTGVGLIAAEQERARTLEGYDAEHDRGHARDLLGAAGCYVQEARALSMGFPPASPGRAPGADDDHPGLTNWPWHPDYWKPTGDPVRDLIKAGSLIASAIDSLLLDQREH